MSASARRALVVGSLLVAAAGLPGCAAKSSAEAASPATQSEEKGMAAPGQPMPAADAAAPTPQLQAGSGRPRTVDEATADVARAEQDLEGALDPKKAVPLGTDRCTVVCKALASMRNATTELCGLTADDRCSDAKGRLAKAEARAKEGCPVCGGA